MSSPKKGDPVCVYFLRRRRWHLRGVNPGRTYRALGLVDPDQALARVINSEYVNNGGSPEVLTEGRMGSRISLS